MGFLKYVYFYAQKSIIKAGNNKFQDLINAPRSLVILRRGKLAVTERNDASQTSPSSEKVFHKGYLFMCFEGSITFHMTWRS